MIISKIFIKKQNIRNNRYIKYISIPPLCVCHTASANPHTPGITKNMINGTSPRNDQNLINPKIPRFRTVAKTNNGGRPVYFPIKPTKIDATASHTPKQIIVYPIHSIPSLHFTND
jgi:hypothetical protein